MQKPFSLLLFTLPLLACWGCGAPKVQSMGGPVSHAIWDSQLRKYVDDFGLVDYQAWLNDTTRLEEYLDILRQNPPNDESWTEADRMAYWINAYNAFTVELILRNYPVEGIKEIKDGIPFVNTVWDIKFITIKGEEFDLNNIEHGILREEFDDPRVHFALVCASMSCPKLQDFAYTGEKLEEQLEEAAREFLNEPFRNELEGDTYRLSRILDWYWRDFKGHYDSHYQLIEQYAGDFADRSKPIEYLEYDWSLNDRTPEKKDLLEGH